MSHTSDRRRAREYQSQEARCAALRCRHRHCRGEHRGSGTPRDAGSDAEHHHDRRHIPAHAARHRSTRRSPDAEQAYYGYVNAHGGVNHRKINDIVLDDQYDPSQTVRPSSSSSRQDHVFAIVGSLGTAPALATWNYLNEQEGAAGAARHRRRLLGRLLDDRPVPADPGVCTTPSRGRRAGSRTIRARRSLREVHPRAQAERRRSASSTRTTPTARTTSPAFKKALGSHKSDIVDKEAYDVGDQRQIVGAHVGALEAHGADTVVLFATPARVDRGARHAWAAAPLDAADVPQQRLGEPGLPARRRADTGRRPTA